MLRLLQCAGFDVGILPLGCICGIALKQSFDEWLAEQQGRPTPVGEFARDVAGDKHIPRGTDLEPWWNYLAECNTSDTAFLGFMTAWREWDTWSPWDRALSRACDHASDGTSSRQPDAEEGAPR
jgi:hypothetical protein